jgi:Family of unknown function (DUF6526)
MSDKTQNFKTHRRMVPGFHFLTVLLALAVIVGGIVYSFNDCPNNALPGSLIAASGLTMMLLGWYARQFAIKAQDRAIRAEENFRVYLLTGKPQDSRLKLSQIIALRFAPDEEYVALAAKAVAENLKADDIKKLIQNWRGDYHRV